MGQSIVVKTCPGCGTKTFMHNERPHCLGCGEIHSMEVEFEADISWKGGRDVEFECCGKDCECKNPGDCHKKKREDGPS